MKIIKIWDKTSTGKSSQCASVYSTEGIFPTINSGTHGYSMGQILLEGEYEIGQGHQLLHRQQLPQRHKHYSQVSATACDGRGGNMKTTIAYSKSTRKSHIDVRGKVGSEANTLSTGDGGANMSSQNFVAEKIAKLASVDAKTRKAHVKAKTVPDVEVAIEPDLCIATRHLGRNGSLTSEISSTVQVSETPHVVTSDIRIRKLTPTECERLQGYPDNHTAFGKKEDGTTYSMSNTQRYKQCGNGVSSPVAATILKSLIPGDEVVRVQSLFSGILGTELNFPPRFELTGTCEFDKYASDVIRFHHPLLPNFHDVTKFIERTDVPDFDLLTFGFPCQSFSIAGLRQGFEDEKGRGQMIYHCFDILEKHKPKYFLAENVKGLLNHDSGKTFIEILKGLSQLGYDIDFELVNSKHFSLAQNRERVFIFGKLK